MNDFDDLKEDLERMRDEINVKMHLASMELKEEWEELDGKWEQFVSRARMGESAKNVGGALDHLGNELKAAYRRIRDAL